MAGKSIDPQQFLRLLKISRMEGELERLQRRTRRPGERYLRQGIEVEVTKVVSNVGRMGEPYVWFKRCDGQPVSNFPKQFETWDEESRFWQVAVRLE